jgi:hypothetical protein
VFDLERESKFVTAPIDGDESELEAMYTNVLSSQETAFLQVNNLLTFRQFSKKSAANGHRLFFFVDLGNEGTYTFFLVR